MYEKINKMNIIRDYMKKYPDYPILTLAKLIYNTGDNNKLFSSINTIRCRIQDIIKGRFKTIPDNNLRNRKELIMEREKLIEGIRSKRSPYKLPKSQSKVLIISDLHIPYHDESTIELALNYGKSNKIDTILINGDFVDYYEVSRFEKDPRKCDLAGSIEKAKSILRYIRKKFPKAKIIYKSGNHDRRLEDFLIRKAPELLGITFWQITDILELNKLDIQYVADLDYVLLGKLKVIHGHEYRTPILAPINPARGLFTKTKESCLASHVHRTSEHSEKTLGGKILSCWTIGCLCELSPDYNPYGNNYNHGFAVVDVDSNGEFRVHNKKIIDNQVF